MLALSFMCHYIFVSQITIEPEMDTLYWCKILKAPVLQDKHHIIGYEALLTKERYFIFAYNAQQNISHDKVFNGIYFSY